MSEPSVNSGGAVVAMVDPSPLVLRSGPVGLISDASERLASNVAASMGILTDHDSPEGIPRSVQGIGSSTSFSDPRASAGTPPSTSTRWGADDVLVGTEAALAFVTPPQAEVDLPDPQMADMILSLLPFDRSSLEGSLEQFLGPFDGLAPSMSGLRGPMGLVTASLTVAITVLTLEVAIRLRRSEEDGSGIDGDEGVVPFPGLPGFKRWSRP